MIKIIALIALGLAVIALNIRHLFELYIGLVEGLVKFEIKGDKAYMKGTISRKTIKRVKDLIHNHPGVKTIVMVKVPGSIDDDSNLIASRLIRQAGLNTHVPKDGLVASGGTDFFCAGIKRTAHPKAYMGVHSWAGPGINDASLLPKDHKEHQKYLDYYKEMKISEDFYWFTIHAAKARDMYNMSQDQREIYLLN